MNVIRSPKHQLGSSVTRAQGRVPRTRPFGAGRQGRRTRGDCGEAWAPGPAPNDARPRLLSSVRSFASRVPPAPPAASALTDLPWIF